MKRLAALFLAAVLCTTVLTGCTSGNSGTSNASSVPAGSVGSTNGENVRIGVIQYVGHPALDNAYKGFVDGLAEAGYVQEQNLTIDLQNAQGESSMAPTIANTLANGNFDLYLAIATPAAQAMAAATKEMQDKPVLITAVTDAVDAGLVASNDAPGGNITGTSDLTPVKEQMELLKKLVPDVKTVGFLYTSSEANSIFQVDIARKAAEEMGLDTIDFTVSNSNEVQQVVQSAVGKVDALYTPTDNIIAQTMSTVARVSNEAGLPVIVGEVGMVDQGGLASYSVDYYELGKITAQMAVEILKDGKKPADMPIRYQQNFELIINKEVAEQLGITVPDDLS